MTADNAQVPPSNGERLREAVRAIEYVGGEVERADSLLQQVCNRAERAERERDAFKDALEYERSLNDSVVAPMRRALEHIAQTRDVDMGGEYIIHNAPALSAHHAQAVAAEALNEAGSSAAGVDGTVSPSGPVGHHEPVGERQGRQPASLTAEYKRLWQEAARKIEAVEATIVDATVTYSVVSDGGAPISPMMVERDAILNALETKEEAP